MCKNIVAVLGDYYHEKDILTLSLKKAVEKLQDKFDIDIKIDFLPRNKLVEHLETKPDAVILAAENRMNPEDTHVKTWMRDDDAIKINNYVKEGGGWLAWHAGLASYEDIKPYIAMLKGYFIHHPQKHSMVRYTTNQKSPFGEKNKTIEFYDEHYFIDGNLDHTNIFLKSESIDGSSIAGWYHKYNNGKVVCLTPAHMKEGLTNESLLEILSDSLGWVSRVV